MSLIAHLSDPHMNGGKSRAARLAAVLHEVAAVGGVDMVVVTGDLAETGAADEYEQFFTLMEAAALPYLVVPGNHDLRAPLAERLQRAGDGPLVSTLNAGGITAIGLDSLVEGEPGGHLDEQCLDAARCAIAAAPGPVVLALHHPPVEVGDHRVDAMGLANPEDLAALITGNDAVLAVLAGHAHTALVTTFATRPMLLAPGIVSTLRLGSRTDLLDDHSAAPALALHTITARHLSTTFHHLVPSPRW